MNRLKELRTDRKLLQKDVAEFLGVERTTYVKYESGASEPSISTLKRLAEFYSVSVGYLLGQEETKKSPLENEELIAKLLNEASNKAVVVMFGGDGPKVVEIPPEAEETVKRMLEAIDKKDTD